MVDKNYVYTYLIDGMPPGIHEMVAPCADGYTVYIDASLDNEHRIKAYEHALSHIDNGDFDIDNTADVQQIEAIAHGIAPEWKEELDRLRKERKKLKAAIRKKEKQIQFLLDAGLDLFNIAENNYLYPPNL